MKTYFLILTLFLASTANAEYQRNPATCVCYSDSNMSDSLRIRFRNGAVEAIAIDQLEFGVYGDDIFAKKIEPNHNSQNEYYEVAENILTVPTNAHSFSSDISYKWPAVIQNAEDSSFIIHYHCSF